MAKTMRAVDIEGGTGPATALHIASIPRPSLEDAPNRALVRVKAFGLNRMDLLQREGHYPLPPQAPLTLGVEFSGVVQQVTNVDEDTETFKPGDEVFGLAYGGAYAEYIVASCKMLMPKPKELSFQQCAGIPEVWFTALQAIHLVGHYSAVSNESILWHAGASSVSIAGQQLIKALAPKASIFATARSDEKCDFCVEELGATAAFNASTDDWADKVLEATGGKGVDVIIDFVGAPYFAQNLKVAARDGRIVCLGMMGGPVLKGGENIGPLVFKRIRVQGSTLRSRDENYQGSLKQLFEKEVIPLLVDGKHTVHVEKVLPWEKIVEAHQLMESNATKGKIVCTID
ncbi:MAG: hypothetical protein M1831_001545 [Alyxoria varia]|nr:MAG: hypothetical protein M1831_001545 [Alyxoria varia]